MLIKMLGVPTGAVAINRDHIASIESEDRATTRVSFSGGTFTLVTGKIDDVILHITNPPASALIDYR